VDPDYSERYGYFTPTEVGDGVTGFTVSTQVSNWGTDPSGSFNVKFYASTNDYISSGDYLIGTVAMSSISSWQSSTATWSGTFPGGVPTGTYYVGWIIDADSAVTELDEDNNKGVITSYQLDVDADDPTNPTAYTSNPAINVWTADNTIYVSWSGASDGSGSGVYGYGLYWSTSPTSLPSAVVDTTNSYTTSSSLTDSDSWYLHIRTRDNVGNWADDAYHVGPFKVDTTEPAWSPVPTDQFHEFGTSFSYQVNATDPRDIDTWWINDTTNFAISATGVVTNIVSLAIGVYGLQVWVNDTLDNTQTATFTVTVDDTLPPTWTETPTDQELHTSQFLEYQLQAEDPSGIASWWIDDTTNFAIDDSGKVTSVGPLPYGVAYELEVKAIDPFGHELSATFTVTCLLILASPLFIGGIAAVIIIVVVLVILLWFFRFRKSK
jgi:hypothetical protein